MRNGFQTQDPRQHRTKISESKEAKQVRPTSTQVQEGGAGQSLATCRSPGDGGTAPVGLTLQRPGAERASRGELWRPAKGPLASVETNGEACR